MSTTPETLAATPVASKPKRSLCLPIAGVAGCLVLCLCISSAAMGWFFYFGAGRTAPIIQSLMGTPTRRALGPTPRAPSQPPGTLAPFPNPVDPGGAGTQTYSGSAAPFTIKYPADWDVSDDEQDNQTVAFTSPDEDASITVMYTPATSQSADAVLQDMLDGLPTSMDTVKVLTKKTNADGSVTAEIEYEDIGLGGFSHGYARVLKTKSNFYIVAFAALDEVFDKYKDSGNASLNSFTAK